MIWWKVRADLRAHPKTRKIPRTTISVPARTAALGVITAAGCWIAEEESGGFVPAEALESFDPDGKLCAMLVAAGFFVPAHSDGEDGYQMPTWAENQGSTARLLATRQRERDKKRRQRERLRTSATSSTSDGDYPSVTVSPGDSPGDSPLSVPPSEGGDKGGDSPPDGPADGPSDADTDKITETPRHVRLVPVPGGHPGGLPSGVPTTSTPPIELEIEEEPPLPPGRGGTRKRGAADDEPPGFAKWYEAYPKKVGRRAAAQAFASAVRRGHDAGKLTAALTAWTAAKPWREDRFIPNPTTWLNQDRFADEAPKRSEPKTFEGWG